MKKYAKLLLFPLTIALSGCGVENISIPSKIEFDKVYNEIEIKDLFVKLEESYGNISEISASMNLEYYNLDGTNNINNSETVFKFYNKDYLIGESTENIEIKKENYSYKATSKHRIKETIFGDYIISRELSNVDEELPDISYDIEENSDDFSSLQSRYIDLSSYSFIGEAYGRLYLLDYDEKYDSSKKTDYVGNTSLAVTHSYSTVIADLGKIGDMKLSKIEYNSYEATNYDSVNKIFYDEIKTTSSYKVTISYTYNKNEDASKRSEFVTELPSSFVTDATLYKCSGTVTTDADGNYTVTDDGYRSMMTTKNKQLYLDGSYSGEISSDVIINSSKSKAYRFISQSDVVTLDKDKENINFEDVTCTTTTTDSLENITKIYGENDELYLMNETDDDLFYEASFTINNTGSILSFNLFAE